MNMRGIDPRTGRDAGDLGLRTECLGHDVRRALVRTAPDVFAFVDMRLDQFGNEGGHRRKARPRGASVATLGRTEVAQDGRKGIVDQDPEIRPPLDIHSGEQRGWDQIVDRRGRVVDEIVEFIFRPGSDSSGIGPSGRPPVRPLACWLGHAYAVGLSGYAALAGKVTIGRTGSRQSRGPYGA